MILEVNNIKGGYQTGVDILRDISFSVNEGDWENH